MKTSTTILLICSLLLILVWLPFSALRTWLESSMVSHLLIQYPIYIGLGFIIGWLARDRLCTSIWLKLCNAGGVSGLILCSFSLAFWMIPRWMDASINEENIAIIKALSLSLLVGFPLAISWHQLHGLVKAFAIIELISMLLRLGWIYRISPDRLCNNYLLNDQKNLGLFLLILGTALSLAWLVEVFFLDSRKSVSNEPVVTTD